jgi:hypothetical protein
MVRIHHNISVVSELLFDASIHQTIWQYASLTKVQLARRTGRRIK